MTASPPLPDASAGLSEQAAPGGESPAPGANAKTLSDGCPPALPDTRMEYSRREETTVNGDDPGNRPLCRPAHCARCRNLLC